MWSIQIALVEKTWHESQSQKLQYWVKLAKKQGYFFRTCGKNILLKHEIAKMIVLTYAQGTFLSAKFGHKHKIGYKIINTFGIFVDKIIFTRIVLRIVRFAPSNILYLSRQEQQQPKEKNTYTQFQQLAANSGATQHSSRKSSQLYLSTRTCYSKSTMPC